VIQSDTLWWEEIVGPSRFLSDIESALYSGRSLLIHTPCAFPYRESFSAALDHRLGNNAIPCVRVDCSMMDGKGDPYRYLIEQTGQPRQILSDYLRQKSQSCAKFLRASGMISGKVIWLHGIPEGQLAYRLTPLAANFTGALSLPISFEKSRFTKCAMIVGENAKYAPEDVVNMPLLLDAYAARILTERGFDVGLAGCEPMDKPATETFPERPSLANPIPTRTMPVDCGGRYFRLTPAEGAETDSFYDNGAPAIYRYVRKNGVPVVVYAFDIETISTESAMVKNYCRQAQLLWMLPAALVEIRKEPGAYVITRKTDDKLVVGIWNFGSDMLLPEYIQLDDEYSTILPIGKTDAELIWASEMDGVTLRGMIPPYCFAGFVVKK